MLSEKDDALTSDERYVIEGTVNQELVEICIQLHARDPFAAGSCDSSTNFGQLS